MDTVIAIAIGLALDFIFGDPHFLPHPVRWMGLAISTGERMIRRVIPKTPPSEITGGAALTLCVVSISYLAPYAILYGAYQINPYFKIAVESLFCYQLIAAKALKEESMKVYDALKKGDLIKARKDLSWIVGRDTDHLSEEKIIKAAIETVAENTSDGVIAPLFYMAIGGAPLAFLYKAVNTMDSMIGYKNDRYLYFGRFAARLDDVLNYIPAILSAYLMMLSCLPLALDLKNSFYIYNRDKNNHSSPNSGKTEAVCAGALNIQIGGDSCYFGKLVQKQTFGDNSRKALIGDIAVANQMMTITTLMGASLFLLARLAGVKII